MQVASLVESVLGGSLPVQVRAYDGSVAGPSDSGAALVVRSNDAFRRILTAPGELGVARAYVSGDLDFEGDIFAGIELRHSIPGLRIGWHDLMQLARVVGWRAL